MILIDAKTLAERYPQASFSSSKGKVHQENAQSDEFKGAFKKIERLVKVRDRSVLEVRTRLERDGFSANAVDVAVERALSVGYLDDARFADVLVRSRLRSGKGLSGILRELRVHAINPFEQLEGFPDDYLQNNPSQEEAAIALLCRKPPQAKNEKQAAYAKLIRSGYSADIAAEATKKWYETKNGG